jgi:hypothetical protein
LSKSKGEPCHAGRYCIPSGGTTVPIVAGSQDAVYSEFGARLYEDISAKIFPLNGYKAPVGTGGCAGSACYIVNENAGLGLVYTGATYG